MREAVSDRGQRETFISLLRIVFSSSKYGTHINTRISTFCLLQEGFKEKKNHLKAGSYMHARTCTQTNFVIIVQRGQKTFILGLVNQMIVVIFHLYFSK